MPTDKTKRFLAVALIAFAFVTQGCSSGTPTEPDIDPFPRVGSLEIAVGANASGGDLTASEAQTGSGGNEPEPFAFADLERIVVFIQSFRFTSPVINTTLFFRGTVDLAALRGETTQVAAFEIFQGTFNDVEIEFDPAQSYAVVNGQARALNFEADSVLIAGTIATGIGTTTTVSLVFDLEQSLTENPDGSWTMEPVVALSVASR